LLDNPEECNPTEFNSRSIYPAAGIELKILCNYQEDKNTVSAFKEFLMV
jgi:hypothetical protein